MSVGENDAQPFLQADLPTAGRLSQTLGRAKNLIMKAHLSLVAPHALSHELQGSRRRITIEALLQ